MSERRGDGDGGGGRAAGESCTLVGSGRIRAMDDPAAGITRARDP